mgnify:CR=1 FL=1
MSDDASERSEPKRKRLRDDPLSIVLIASALLLAVVYVWDNRTRETLREQMTIAESIQEGFRVDSGRCTVGTADEGGRVLVIACSGIAAADIAGAASASEAVRKRVDHFDELLIRTPSSSLTCPPRPDAWPEACTSIELNAESTAGETP